MIETQIKKWVGAIVIFFGFYSATWTLAESSGFTTDKYPLVPLFLTVSSVIITSIYFLVYSLVKLITQNQTFQEKITFLEKELEESKKHISYCCVTQQKIAKCPVGIKSINTEMKKTLTTSLVEAKKTFKWLGLSAFNVVHNNRDIFAQKRDVSYEFTLSNPENKDLPIMNDKWFGDSRGRMNSEELIISSDNILKKLKADANNKIEINYINQIPSFRIIIVDDKKVYVSFYEPLVDALKSTQLEIVEDEEIPASMFNWFKWYYQKTFLNEDLAKKTFSNNSDG